jgi:sugar lactone lactonase YvrE
MKSILATFLILSICLVFSLPSCNVGSMKNKDEEKDSVRKFTLTEQWRTDTILRTPESVIYDRKRDILYVSNVNFEPRMKDMNGFISRMDKTGRITDLKWIEGLSGPKGMAIVGDTLYAADVDELVVMDINKGVIIRKIPVTAGRMLNDITSDNQGNLYISDTDDNKIHKYSGGRVTEWFTGILGPNGVLFDGDRLLVASQAVNNLSAIDIATKEHTTLTDSLVHADGIAFTGIPGYYIVTDWEGEIFMINHDNSRTSLLRTKDMQMNTADIEYIQEERLLFVPTFFSNSVIAYKLEEIVR